MSPGGCEWDGHTAPALPPRLPIVYTILCSNSKQMVNKEGGESALHQRRGSANKPRSRAGGVQMQ